MIKYLKLWNKWRKNSLNSSLYKLLVLVKILKSPTFENIKIHERFIQNDKN